MDMRQVLTNYGHSDTFVQAAMERLHAGKTVALNTPYTIVDASGMPLCHTMASSREGASATTTRKVKDAFMAMLTANGDVMANGAVRCTDGRFRNVRPAGYAGDLSKVMDRSHVIPEQPLNGLRGAYCPCNLLPESAEVNTRRGDVVANMSGRDARTAWATVAGIYMTSTKRARRAN